MAVTHKDIAYHAGVSAATVSRALRNDPKISRATIARVKKAAEKLGYRPDPVLSGLAAYRSRLRPTHQYEKIAVLGRVDWQERLPSLPSGLYAGIGERATELGFGPELCYMDDDQAAQRRVSRRLTNQGVRGVILLPVRWRLRGFDWSPFSVVGIGEFALSYGMHNLHVDHDAAICECYRQLTRRGYRNIGFQNGAASEKRNRHLFFGAYAKCRALDGLSVIPPLLYKKESEAARAPDWIREHRLDAVICSDMQLLQTLRDAGLKVPEAVGVVGYNFSPDNAQASGYAAYLADNHRLGRLAMDQLHSIILKNQYGIPPQADQNSILLRSTWQDGPSVRAVT